MSCGNILGVELRPVDAALAEVQDFFLRKSDLISLVGISLRRSFDEVIDGARTGRFRIEDLEKTEKTYIGTKVEIVLRSELELQRGVKLDNLVFGHEVDTKFSISGNWMIPKEAVGEICLLIEANDNRQEFSLGLLRMLPEVLTAKGNQDGKKTVSSVGKSTITWIARNAPMPPNFLLQLDERVRLNILSQKGGVGRIRELFRTVTGKVIPRIAIEQVAQQKDPLRRARQMKIELRREGYEVLCAKYDEDRIKMVAHGFKDLKSDDWVSIHSTDYKAA